MIVAANLAGRRGHATLFRYVRRGTDYKCCTAPLASGQLAASVAGNLGTLGRRAPRTLEH